MARVHGGAIANVDMAATGKSGASFPSQIGEALWRARMRSGLSVAEVAERIGVESALLAAIEDSSFDMMPPLDRAVALVRSYSHLVGLPVDWAAETLEAEIAARR